MTSKLEEAALKYFENDSRVGQYDVAADLHFEAGAKWLLEEAKKDPIIHNFFVEVSDHNGKIVDRFKTEERQIIYLSHLEKLVSEE